MRGLEKVHIVYAFWNTIKIEALQIKSWLSAANHTKLSTKSSTRKMLQIHNFFSISNRKDIIWVWKRNGKGKKNKMFNKKVYLNSCVWSERMSAVPLHYAEPPHFLFKSKNHNCNPIKQSYCLHSITATNSYFPFLRRPSLTTTK